MGRKSLPRMEPRTRWYNLDPYPFGCGSKRTPGEHQIRNMGVHPQNGGIGYDPWPFDITASSISKLHVPPLWRFGWGNPQTPPGAMSAVRAWRGEASTDMARRVELPLHLFEVQVQLPESAPPAMRRDENRAEVGSKRRLSEKPRSPPRLPQGKPWRSGQNLQEGIL